MLWSSSEAGCGLTTIFAFATGGRATPCGVTGEAPTLICRKGESRRSAAGNRSSMSMRSSAVTFTPAELDAIIGESVDIVTCSVRVLEIQIRLFKEVCFQNEVTRTCAVVSTPSCERRGRALSGCDCTMYLTLPPSLQMPRMFASSRRIWSLPVTLDESSRSLPPRAFPPAR